MVINTSEFKFIEAWRSYLKSFLFLSEWESSTPTQFNGASGKNFHYWSHSMWMILIFKNKLKFVDRSLHVPNRDDPLYGAWNWCNALVISWIMRSLSPSIAHNIIWIDWANDLWKDLHDRFTQSDVGYVFDLQDEMYLLK